MSCALVEFINFGECSPCELNARAVCNKNRPRSATLLSLGPGSVFGALLGFWLGLVVELSVDWSVGRFELFDWLVCWLFRQLIGRLASWVG